MITYANQKVITTKKTLSDGEHVYSIVNAEACRQAIKTLSRSSLPLYIRMVLNQDDYQFALSPKTIKQEIGMSDKQYRHAIKELIDTGYLVQRHPNSNEYVFYEAPQEDSPQYMESMQRRAEEVLSQIEQCISFSPPFSGSESYSSCFKVETTECNLQGQDEKRGRNVVSAEDMETIKPVELVELVPQMEEIIPVTEVAYIPLRGGTSTLTGDMFSPAGYREILQYNIEDSIQNNTSIIHECCSILDFERMNNMEREREYERDIIKLLDPDDQICFAECQEEISDSDWMYDRFYSDEPF